MKKTKKSIAGITPAKSAKYLRTHKAGSITVSGQISPKNVNGEKQLQKRSSKRHLAIKLNTAASTVNLKPTEKQILFNKGDLVKVEAQKHSASVKNLPVATQNRNQNQDRRSETKNSSKVAIINNEAIIEE
jgi:hypothetical protein